MSDINTRATIGSNNPPPDPIDLELVLDADILRDQLELDYAARLKRRDELLAASERFLASHPAIETEDVQARATDFVDQIKACSNAAEAGREKEGRKFLTATGVVNAFFKAGIKDKLDAEIKKIEGKMTLYARAKADRARVAAEAEAARAAAEARRIAEEAERTMRPTQLQEAVVAEQVAEKAQKLAEAPTAAFGRSRGDGGAVASLRKSWVFEVQDLADVPTEYLLLDGARVRAAIAAGERDIPGLRIYEDAQVRVR